MTDSAQATTQSQEAPAAALEALYRAEFPALVALDEAAYFVDEGALDSYDYINLLTALETRFALKIPDDDVREENFGSKAAIRAYIERALAAR